jgi:hypothetical protein
MAAKVGAGKRRLLLQARAEGKSLADAAEAAGVSTRTAERLSVDPTFRAELQARLAELDAEDRNAFAQHRRQVLTASRFALAKQLEVLSSNAAAVVRERAARAVQEHLARLFPAALDVSIATAELVQPTPERTLRDIFVVADDADHAQVIDVGRAAYGRLVADARARGEPTEGEAHAMRAREDEMVATLQAMQAPERVGLRVVGHATNVEPGQAPSEPAADELAIIDQVLSANRKATLFELRTKDRLSFDEERQLAGLEDEIERVRDARAWTAAHQANHAGHGGR